MDRRTSAYTLTLQPRVVPMEYAVVSCDKLQLLVVSSKILTIEGAGDAAVKLCTADPHGHVWLTLTGLLWPIRSHRYIHGRFVPTRFIGKVPYYLAKWNLRGTILCYIISPIFAAPIPYRIKNWDIWYQKPRTFCMRNWYFLPLIARNPTIRILVIRLLWSQRI